MDAQLLDLIKIQCRVDDINDEREDALLEHYYEAAKLTVLRLTERTEEELLNNAGELPADVLQVILMLVSHQYENRGAAANANQALDMYARAVLANHVKLSNRKA